MTHHHYSRRLWRRHSPNPLDTRSMAKDRNLYLFSLKKVLAAFALIAGTVQTQ